MGWRFASAADREMVVGAVALAAQAASMRLAPDESACTPATFRRPDGEILSNLVDGGSGGCAFPSS
ncbi:MAG: hypothetical protein LBK95_15810 [Bifidobacteriaceae bacterium]|jgi:hypothetical protein|nr:hypothetical protein [Bifidobacteriaceae bacterium]